MIKVLFAASECEPFVKTGGLADVIGSLPNELRNYGVDVRVIIPKYIQIPEHFRNQMKHITNFNVRLGWRNQYCGIEELVYRGVTYYFVDNEYYFSRDEIYCSWDEAERSAYFCRAVLEALPHIPFKPDIIHCNEWHTAPICALLKEQYHTDAFYENIRTFLTIHNLRYQGVFHKEVLSDLLNLGEECYSQDKFEHYGNVNFLKGGIAYADLISTVSETYAEEIQTPDYGEGLDGIVRKRRDDLYGITNGIDYQIYNPNCDPYISANYSKTTGKAFQNKLKLQHLLNLPEREETPIICIVSRLVPEKGLELVMEILDELLTMDVQFIVLGTGDEEIENFFNNKAAHYKDKLSTNLLFDSSLAHKIYAGSDFCLMPSMYEPCGLSQLIALSYGTIPIVRETGGLNDTIQSFNEYTNKGNGLSFKNADSKDMLYTIRRGLELYHDKQKWNTFIKNAMNCDFSWRNSAQKYISLYKYLEEKPL